MVRSTCDDLWYLIGIVSYGYGCGAPKSPTIFLRVSAYIPWMSDNVPGLFEFDSSTDEMTTESLTINMTTELLQSSAIKVPASFIIGIPLLCYLFLF